MLRLFRFALRAHPVAILVIVVFSVLNAAFEGLGLSILMLMVERLQSPETAETSHPLSAAVVAALRLLDIEQTIWALMASVLVIFIVQALFQYLRVDLGAKASAQVAQKLRVTLFASVIEASTSYFDKKRIGTTANGIVTEPHRAGVGLKYLIEMLVDGVLVVVYLLVATAISWRLSLIVFAVMGLGAYLLRSRGGVYLSGELVRRGNEKLHDSVVEKLSGIREIKLFGLESSSLAVFRRVAGEVSLRYWLLDRLKARYRYLYKAAASLLLLVIIAFAFYAFEVAAAEIVVFLAVLFRLSTQVPNLQASRDKVQGHLPGFDAVMKLTEEATANRLVTAPAARTAVDRWQKIDLRGVCFAYDGRPGDVLSDLGVCFERGRSYALVGASGAGKSTLVSLVAGLYLPTAGKIVIDDQNLRDIDLASWRRRIGFVSQDTFLFNESVRENIRIGDLAAGEKAIQEAARLAHIHEVIAELPDAYDTVVGDRGVRLSGGQRQRLALARAFLREPELLILDEATSDLDSESESLIQQALEKLRHGRTVIAIAHRLSTVMQSDWILVLEKGRIVEAGQHEDLLARGRYYRRYYELQHGE